jgi:catabolite regulation protein CreA
MGEKDILKILEEKTGYIQVHKMAFFPHACRICMGKDMDKGKNIIGKVSLRIFKKLGKENIIYEAFWTGSMQGVTEYYKLQKQGKVLKSKELTNYNQLY